DREAGTSEGLPRNRGSLFSLLPRGIGHDPARQAAQEPGAEHGIATLRRVVRAHIYIGAAPTEGIGGIALALRVPPPVRMNDAGCQVLRHAHLLAHFAHRRLDPRPVTFSDPGLGGRARMEADHR